MGQAELIPNYNNFTQISFSAALLRKNAYALKAFKQSEAHVLSDLEKHSTACSQSQNLCVSRTYGR